MQQRGASGKELASAFQLDAAPVLQMRVLGKADVVCTDIRIDHPTLEMSAEIAKEDAFLVALNLRESRLNDYWEGGRNVSMDSLKWGDTSIYDLKRGRSVLMDKPSHAMLFYLSRPTLDTIAEEADAPRISELHYQAGKGYDDSTMRGLCMALYPAFENPEHASRMFMDHVTMAVATHVAQTYGGMRTTTRPAQGGLAPWQIKRAQDHISASLDGSVPLKTLAQDCGLSVSHFSRAFKQSTGMAPHAWLLQRRVDVATALLANRRLTLSEVALRCGFADQSHFTRVFSRYVGVSPGLWRQANSLPKDAPTL
jgi:AraC family transcriptional regulator